MLISSDGAELTRELVGTVPRQEGVVFKLSSDADRGVVSGVFPRLQRTTAVLSFTGGPDFARDEVARTTTPPSEAAFAYFESQKHGRDWLEPLLQSHRAFVCVTGPDAQPHAVCFAFENYRQVWEIGGLYTPPESRGRGHAARVVRTALAERRAGWCRAIRCTTTTSPRSPGRVDRADALPRDHAFPLHAGSGPTMTSELWQLSADALRGMIAARQVSPVEVTQAVLDRIDALQPKLNCFITVCHEHALAQARWAEESAMRGGALGLLHGVPYHVKDLVNTAGVRTTFGSLLQESNVPKTDAVAAARMKAAGGILVGKTTTPEFGHKALSDGPLFGKCHNAGTRAGPRAAPAAAPRSPSPPAWHRSASPPMAAARRAYRRPAMAWSA